MRRGAVLLALLLASPLGAAPAPSPAKPTAAPARAPVDPARLAVANDIVAKVLPPGSYRTLMQGSMDQVMGMMRGQMYDLPVRQLAKAANLTDAQLAAIGPGTVREVMAILDPAFEQRQAIIGDTMMKGLIDVIADMEPELRAGMAEAYARRLSLADLEATCSFFRTPAGAAYAAQVMQVSADPAFMDRMRAMMPRLTGSLPAMLQKGAAATSGLPKPRRYDDLTAAEQARLRQLLGSPVEPRH